VKVGPGDTFRSHCPNEYLTIQELEAGAAFYAKLIPAFFKMQAANQETGAR
jgi:acetylornithine deacetylase